MNADDQNPDLQSWIEPELEARIVAAVLGEASAFEVAELERIAAERPEVALFRRRIEAAHGLVAAASRPDEPARRLAPERREKLLAALGGTATNAPNVSALRRPRMPVWLNGRVMLRVAAVLVVGVLVATFFSSVRTYEGSRERQLASATKDLEVAKKPVSWGFGPQIGADVGGAGGGLAMNSRAPVSAAVAAPKPAAPVDVRSAPTVTVTSGQLAKVELAQDLQSQRRLDAPEASARSASGTAGFASVADESTREPDATSAMGADAVRMEERPVAKAMPVPPAARQREIVSQQLRNEPAMAGSVADATLDDSKALDGLGTPVTAGVSNSVSLPTGKKGSIVVTGLNKALVTSANGVVFGLRGEPVTAGLVQSEVKTKDITLAESVATEQPFSTFSLHVSDVSFLLAKDALARGEMPDPARIRPEEFYNAFDYGDPAPGVDEPVACRIEQARAPFRQQRNLVRIAVKVAATGRAAGQPLRLTILLDTSGSMEREDRAASVRRALTALASLLGPNDRVTLVGFARQPRLLAESVPGDQASKLAEIAAQTPADGGTNLEAALVLATELAEKQWVAGAQNRVVLLTDGAANLGNADPAQLARRVETLRQQGIAFDACGVGANGLNDEVLEALTRKGDGRSYFLEKPEDADAAFARRLAGAFRPAAENVKVQVHFNPQRVGRYRLLGFEQHRLATEDFRNDRVDAAELATDEAGVALYEVEPLPGGEGELGEVFVRFRDPANGAMVERSWTMAYDAQAPAFDQASPSLRLAGTAALLAEKLRGGPDAGLVDLNALAPIITALRGDYPHQARVNDLAEMFRQMRR